MTDDTDQTPIPEAKPARKPRKPRTVAPGVYTVTYLRRVTEVAHVTVMAPNQAEAQKIADAQDPGPTFAQVGSATTCSVARLGE